MIARPIRVQLSRKAGWRMPPNTVKVDRSTKYGNPFVDGEWTNVWHRPGSAPGWPIEPVYRDGFKVIGVDHAVRLFRIACEQREDWYHDTWRCPDLAPLRGKNLACWCPLDQPCHADVLLELANRDEASLQVALGDRHLAVVDVPGRDLRPHDEIDHLAVGGDQPVSVLRPDAGAPEEMQRPAGDANPDRSVGAASDEAVIGEVHG